MLLMAVSLKCITLIPSNVFRDQNPLSIIVLCGDFNNLDTDDLVLDCGLYDVLNDLSLL